MKIAIPTTDGVTIASHFGAAPYFMVLEIENGKIKNKDLRKKPGHEHHTYDVSHTPQNHARRHQQIAAVIQDCNVVIAANMGAAAYYYLKDLGFEVILSDVENLVKAALLYTSGALKHNETYVHTEDSHHI